MEEIWKPVPIKWLSRTFEISNLGNVRHAPLPVSTRNVFGYRQATFKYRGRELTVRVHRLVAGAFIGDPSKGQVVNHKNSDRADNRVENLEWVTTRENADHASKSGYLLRGLDHHRGKIYPPIAFEMHRCGHSYREIGDRFGATVQAAFQMIKRAKKSGHYDRT